MSTAYSALPVMIFKLDAFAASGIFCLRSRSLTKAQVGGNGRGVGLSSQAFAGRHASVDFNKRYTL